MFKIFYLPSMVICSHVFAIQIFFQNVVQISKTPVTCRDPSQNLPDCEPITIEGIFKGSKNRISYGRSRKRQLKKRAYIKICCWEKSIYMKKTRMIEWKKYIKEWTWFFSSIHERETFGFIVAFKRDRDTIVILQKGRLTLKREWRSQVHFGIHFFSVTQKKQEKKNC